MQGTAELSWLACNKSRGTAKCQERCLNNVQEAARVQEAEALEDRNGKSREDQRARWEELAAQGTRFYPLELSLFEDFGQDLLRDIRNRIF